jgi:uncharacterized RDD family membrane protein YckC
MASTDFRPDFQVVTPERVSLQYDIAGIGSRGAAILVDLLVQSAISMALYFLMLGVILVTSVIGFVSGGGDAIGTGVVVVFAVFFVALFALTMGYSMVFEIIWNGQTPGKRAVGIRVIRENGYPIRPLDAVIRNIVRIVDYLPFLYSVGVFTMLLNGRARRLGDFAAGTIVVHEGPNSTADFITTESATDEPPGTSLQRDEATLVRDFLSRRTSLDPDPRRELAERLASTLASRYSLSLEPNPEAFLERLVA